MIPISSMVTRLSSQHGTKEHCKLPMYVRTYVRMCAWRTKNDLLANCSLLQFMAEKQTKDTSKQKLPFLLLHSLISSSMRKKGRQDMYPAHDFEGGEKCS